MLPFIYIGQSYSQLIIKITFFSKKHRHKLQSAYDDVFTDINK